MASVKYCLERSWVLPSPHVDLHPVHGDLDPLYRAAVCSVGLFFLLDFYRVRVCYVPQHLEYNRAPGLLQLASLLYF